MTMMSMEKEDCLNEIDKEIANYEALHEKYQFEDFTKADAYKNVLAGLDKAKLIVLRNIK